MTPIYTVTDTATGDGRNGHTTSEDGLLDVDLRLPVEMGGAGGATNPEQLFAAGYSACFHSAMKHVGAGFDLSGSAVSATVHIGPLPGGAFGLAVDLDIHIPNLDHDAALALVQQAHETCPYSNATRGNIEVNLQIV